MLCIFYVVFSITINFILLSDIIIKNPVKIINKSEIDDYIIYLNDDKIKLKTGNKLEIKKDKNEIKYNDQYYHLSPNILLCKTELSYYYLFANSNYYSKFPNLQDNDIIRSLNLTMTLPSDIRYEGFIMEKKDN